MAATTERLGQLVRGVFSVLLEHPDGLQASEAIRETEKRVPPNPDELGSYPKHPSERIYSKTIRFATIRPVKAGWMQKDNGIWMITPEGKIAFEQMPDPKSFYQRAQELYREWIEKSDEKEEENADELLEAEATALLKIREHLETMDPIVFQKLIGALLRAMSYHIIWIAPAGAAGTDIIASADPLGIAEPRIKVEAKRRQQKADKDMMKSFAESLGNRDAGIFVSLSGFTLDAYEFAREHQSKRITAIDFGRLLELWKEYYAKMAEIDQQFLPLKEIAYLRPPTVVKRGQQVT